ncbi:hypothetical protein GCM10007036_02600 [Alsobacter metallidurans]|uniref:Secreted protein n=1 Tax=Alsobacter metallidurans TaxID=340221 RepID=A0A917MFZ5_9HYPH|nr:hypothetical protein [Alsobacter metallidurans]GGH07650.1 hypothetical protein GCM10007036_02600 [Alsobacter metallidurans]
MRLVFAWLAFVLSAHTARAQIISIDAYVTQVDVGVIETELTLYERKNAIYALFTAKGPFEANARELNVTKDGCHEVFYSGMHEKETFTVSLTACSSSAYCRDERQYLALKATYTVMNLGSGRRPQVKAAPIVKAIRPALRHLPC